jgi:RecA-family ATPase
VSGLGKPLYFDLSGSPPPPRWLVDSLIERGTVNLLAGDSGTAKSFLSTHLLTALLRGEEWLGFKTHGERVLVLDNENSPRLVEKRLRMLGFANEDRERLRYFSRTGVQLGSGEWMARTMEEVNSFDPDLIVLDTVSSTTTAVVNDNDTIAHLYATVLRPLAGLDRAVLVQHHERKPSDGFKRDARNAVLGGVHWRTQADAMLSVERKGELEREGALVSFPILLTMPKSRDGETLHVSLRLCSEGGHAWFERVLDP